MRLIDKIKKFKIIPVAIIESVENAIPLGNALIEAELPIVEITFRTDAAEESIRILKKEIPDLILGAGTVLTTNQIQRARSAGAEFIVSPGFNPKIVDTCIQNEIPIFPGIDSPSFIEWGLERGLNIFKLFPADLSGGPAFLKALSGPYQDVNFIPTGGVNNNNLIEYLKLRNVIACGGSWIVPKDLISSKNFLEITKRIKQALALIQKELK